MFVRSPHTARIFYWKSGLCAVSPAFPAVFINSAGCCDFCCFCGYLMLTDPTLVTTSRTDWQIFQKFLDLFHQRALVRSAIWPEGRRHWRVSRIFEVPVQYPILFGDKEFVIRPLIN